MPQESRSAAVKVKGGTMLFLAGHTASLPQANAELGNFDAQFKRVFDKIKTTLSQGGATIRRYRYHVGVSNRSPLHSRVQ